MSGIISKINANKNKRTNAIVSNTVKSYADEPLFVEIAAKAKAILDRVGLPGQKKK